MIINGQLYEVEPAIEAYIKDLQAENEEQRREILRLTDALKEADEVEAFLREKERQEFVNAARFCETIANLKAENARLEEGYQKSLGVIAATDCVECKKDAEPVKHGRWSEDDEGFYHCSVCKELSDWEHRYCPNCGAKMDGGAE